MQAPRDAHQDEPDPVRELPGQRLTGVHPWAIAAWDAWDDVRRDEAAYEHRAQHCRVADAEKLADRERDDRVQDADPQKARLRLERVEPVPCRPGEGPSAARSFAAEEFADARAQREQLVWVRLTRSVEVA